MKSSADLLDSFNRGFKSAALKFVPDLVSAEYQADQYKIKNYAKSIIIGIRDETIQNQAIDIINLELKLKNRNIWLAVGIPAGFVVGGIITALIVVNIKK